MIFYAAHEEGPICGRRFVHVPAVFGIPFPCVGPCQAESVLRGRSLEDASVRLLQVGHEYGVRPFRQGGPVEFDQGKAEAVVPEETTRVRHPLAGLAALWNGASPNGRMEKEEEGQGKSEQCFLHVQAI